MALLLKLAVVYWLASLAILLGAMLLCPDSRSAFPELREKLGGGIRYYLTVAIGGLLLAVVAPILAPHCLITGWIEDRRHNKYIDHLLRTHTEHLFEPLHEVNLPPAVRKEFDQQTQQLANLGFATIGNYRMKQEPENYFGRILQSADGQIICGLLHLFDQFLFSYSTMLEEGRMVETAGCQPFARAEWFLTSTQMRAVFAPDSSLIECLQIHQQAIKDLTAETRAQPVRFEPEQALDVLRYENRLFSKLLYEQGEKDAPPPEPVKPEGTRVETSEPALA